MLFLLRVPNAGAHAGVVPGLPVVRAYAVTVGRGLPVGSDVPEIPGPARIVETSRVGIALYLQAGVLVIQSRRPRTGGVVLDLADLLDEALEILRALAGGGG